MRMLPLVVALLLVTGACTLPQDGDGEDLPCRTVDDSVVVASIDDATQLEDVCIITGALVVTGSLETFSLPALTRVDGSIDISDEEGNALLETVALPSLSFTGGLKIASAASLTTLAVPALARVDGALEIQGTRSLTILSIPALASLGDDLGLLRVVDNAALTSISFPALESVGELPLVNPLEEAGGLDVNANPLLESIDLSALARSEAGVIVVNNQALASIAFPQLETVGALGITLNPVVTSIEMPALRRAQGISIDSFSPGLLTTLSLPALEEVERGLVVRTTLSLEELSLPALTSVGGELGVIQTEAMTTIALPLLESVGLTVNVSENTTLAELLMPSLASVGSSILIFQNPALTTCTGALIQGEGDCPATAP